NLHHLADYRLFQRLAEPLEMFFFPRHWLGADKIRPGNARTIAGLNARLVPCAVGAQPKGKAGNLNTPRVDFYAMEVVFDDEARHLAQEYCLVGKGTGEGDEGREGLGRLRRLIGAVRNFPCVVVDHDKEVKRVETEVHRAARGIEKPDIARVFERTVRNV